MEGEKVIAHETCTRCGYDSLAPADEIQSRTACPKCGAAKVSPESAEELNLAERYKKGEFKKSKIRTCESEYDPSDDCPKFPGRCCYGCPRWKRCRLPHKCTAYGDRADCYIGMKQEDEQGTL